MYKMWNAKFEKVRDVFYRPNYFGNSLIKPFRFAKESGNVTSELRIEDIDAITSRCISEEDFIAKLKKYGSNYIIDDNNHDLSVTHTYRNRIIEDKIIYNDKLVYICSKEKQNHTINSNNPLKYTKELDSLVEYIKVLVLNPYSRDYILNQDNLNDIDNTKYELKKYISNDVVNSNNKKVHQGLKGILEEYLRNKTNYDQYIEMGISTGEISRELSNSETKLKDYFRTNYKKVRDAVVWENLYQDILKKQISNSNDLESINKYRILLEEVKLQKDYRNGKCSIDMLDAFYNEKNIRLSLKEDDIIFVNTGLLNDFENEDIKQDYLEGGMDMVMRNIDTDTLYGTSKYDSDISKIDSNFVKRKV